LTAGLHHPSNITRPRDHGNTAKRNNIASRPNVNNEALNREDEATSRKHAKKKDCSEQNRCPSVLATPRAEPLGADSSANNRGDQHTQRQQWTTRTKQQRAPRQKTPEKATAKRPHTGGETSKTTTGHQRTNTSTKSRHNKDSNNQRRAGNSEPPQSKHALNKREGTERTPWPSAEGAT